MEHAECLIKKNMNFKLLSLRKVHYYYIKCILVVICNKNWSHETVAQFLFLCIPINFAVAFMNLNLYAFR